MQMPDHYRRRVQVIDWNIEEARDLLGVQIHGEHSIYPGGGQKIRNQFCRDRHSGLIFSILPGVTEKWNDCRDAHRARSAGRIDHDQKLHEVLIRRRARGLDDEDVPTPDILVNLYKCLAIRERRDGRIPKLHSDIGANPLRQLAVSGAGEDFELGAAKSHF